MNRPTWRIGTRLLLAQALVLIGAIATAGVIAALVGPPLFHEHMLKATPDPTPTELEHVEEAFRAASAISLGLAWRQPSSSRWWSAGTSPAGSRPRSRR